MSLKNINKLLFLSLFLFSCKVTELLNERKIVYSENNEAKEDIAYIELDLTESLNIEFIDFPILRINISFLCDQSRLFIGLIYLFQFNN